MSTKMLKVSSLKFSLYPWK